MGDGDLASAVTRIDKGAEPDAGQMSGPPGGDVAEEMREHALRQIIGFDLVRYRQPLQLGHEAPVSANYALDQAFVTEVIEPAFLAVALTSRIHEREITRISGSLLVLALSREVQPLQCNCNFFRKSNSNEA